MSPDEPLCAILWKERRPPGQPPGQPPASLLGLALVHMHMHMQPPDQPPAGLLGLALVHMHMHMQPPDQPPAGLLGLALVHVDPHHPPPWRALHIVASPSHLEGAAGGSSTAPR